MPFAVNVLVNGVSTVETKAVPVQTIRRVSPEYMTYEVRPSIVSELFGSSVMSPVPLFFRNTRQPLPKVAAAAKVCENVPEVISMKLSLFASDRIVLDVRAA